ncbi:MAG: hypothetical protein O9340_14510 [Cyclobacteriaceae bacterium]|jgi:hypothetical protein|nr:hypothetical protein [Cyclobacteriaceae bacterium]
MFARFFIKSLPLDAQLKYVLKNGLYIGPRQTSGRTAHLHMVDKKVVEVLYLQDDENNKPEKITWLPGLENLESHLQRDLIK